MSSFPDYGLPGNANTTPKLSNLPISSKFRSLCNRLVEESIIESISLYNKPTAQRQSPVTTAKVSPKPEDETLENCFANIFIEHGTSLSIQERRLAMLRVMVQHWKSNMEHYQKTKPSKYITLVYEEALMFGCRSVWKSKKSLTNEFSNKSLARRFLELVNSGIDRPTVEKYLKWQANRPASYLFPDLCTISSSIWTDSKDKQLLMFVSQQNGLFQEIEYTDWYAEVHLELKELRKFHPEDLRFRFISQYHKNMDALSKFLSRDEILQQLNKAQIRLKLEEQFVANGIELSKTLAYMKEQGFNGNSFLSWISLSSFIRMDTKTTLIRKMFRKYLLTINPVSESALYKAAGEDDEWCILFRDEHVELRDILKSTTCSFLDDPGKWNNFSEQMKKFPNGTELCVTKLCKESIRRIIPLFTHSKVKNELTGLDLLVFEIVKGWQTNTTSKIARANFFQIEDTILGDIRCKHLSDQDILNILESEETEIISSPSDVIIENMPTENETPYSRKFCWRKLSEPEWRLIVQTAFLIGTLNEVDFKKQTTWREIVAASGISTGKHHQVIMKEFFKDILPKLNQYCGKEVCDELLPLIQA